MNELTLGNIMKWSHHFGNRISLNVHPEQSPSQEPDDDSHQRISLRTPANPGEDIALTDGGEEREQRHLPGLVINSSQLVPVRGVMLTTYGSVSEEVQDCVSLKKKI